MGGEVKIALEDVRIQFRMSFDNEPSIAGVARQFVKRVTKRWRPSYFVALDGIDLAITDGEIVGLVGPNGCGKTTLLRTISGIFVPDAGRVTVRGQVSALLALGTGFDVNLSGLDNIRLNGLILGHSMRDIEARMAMITEFADIGEFVHVPMKYYSTGMISRLSFAMILAMEPDILLIDETLSVGDLAFQEKSKAAMRDMLARASCQVIVSHDLEFIERVCTRTVFMASGRIMADGEPRHVLEEYRAFAATQKREEPGHRVLTERDRKGLYQ